jgi:hypothetical protein
LSPVSVEQTPKNVFLDRNTLKHLIIYSRPGCHLCDDMKAVVQRVIARTASGTVSVTEIDISTDQALEQIFGEEIPVLLIDGRKAAKYRVTETELTRKLLISPSQ